MNQELETLKREVEELKAFTESLKSSSAIPLEVDQAFRDRFYRSNSGLLTLAVADGGTGATSLTGILKGNGTSAITAVTQLAGTFVYYVSDTNGGATNRKLTFTDGILVSQT